jgi:serine/threonine protein kinase
MVDDPFVQIDAAEELAAPRLGSDVDADSATNAFVCAVGAGTLQSLKLKPRRKFGSRPISEIIGNETEQKRLFSHFISEMLQWDPLARAEPEALLKHPFLSLGAGHGSGQLSLASISTAHNSSRSKRSESSRSRKSKEMAELQLPAVPK